MGTPLAPPRLHIQTHHALSLSRPHSPSTTLTLYLLILLTAQDAREMHHGFVFANRQSGKGGKSRKLVCCLMSIVDWQSRFAAKNVWEYSRD